MKFISLRLLILSAVLVFAISLPVMAEGVEIEVGAYVFPPASYVDDDGQLTGITVNTLDTVLRAMGYEPKFTLMPFRRCLDSMKDGLIPIMLPCVINESRLVYMQYSDPVYSIDSVLWKKGKGTSSCWNDFKDLAGLRIGASLGYAYGPEWDEAVEKRIFQVDYVGGKDPETAHFSKLLVNRSDMFICEKRLGQFIKQKHSPKFDSIHFCPKSVGPDRPFCAPISRKYFKDNGLDPDEFLRRFNEELAKIDKS